MAGQIRRRESSSAGRAGPTVLIPSRGPQLLSDRGLTLLLNPGNPMRTASRSSTFATDSVIKPSSFVSTVDAMVEATKPWFQNR